MKKITYILLLILLSINLIGNSKVSSEIGKEEMKVFFDKDINIDKISFKIKEETINVNNEKLLLNERNLEVYYNSNKIYEFTKVRYKSINIKNKSKDLNYINIKLVF